MKRRQQFPNDVIQDSTDDLHKSNYAKLPEWLTGVTRVDGFQDHHPEIVDGLEPHNVIYQFGRESGISTGTKIITHSKLPFKFISKEPQTSENPDFAHMFSKSPHFADPTFTTSHREGTYAKLAHHVFGLGKYVPPTTLYSYKGKQHSAQIMVPDGTSLVEHMMDTRDANEDDPKWSPGAELEKLAPLHERQKMAIMNTIMGNHDRHSGNVMVNKQGLHLIDHGAAFDYSHKPYFGKMSIPDYMAHHEFQDGLIEPETAKWVAGLDHEKLYQLARESKMPEGLAQVAKERLRQVKLKVKMEPNTTLQKIHNEALVHNVDGNGQKQIKMV